MHFNTRTHTQPAKHSDNTPYAYARNSLTPPHAVELQDLCHQQTPALLHPFHMAMAALLTC